MHCPASSSVSKSRAVPPSHQLRTTITVSWQPSASLRIGKPLGRKRGLRLLLQLSRQNRLTAQPPSNPTHSRDQRGAYKTAPRPPKPSLLHHTPSHLSLSRSAFTSIDLIALSLTQSSILHSFRPSSIHLPSPSPRRAVYLDAVHYNYLTVALGDRDLPAAHSPYLLARQADLCITLLSPPF